MDPIAIIVFAFLAVALPIGLIRARNTLRQHDDAQAAKKPVQPVSYTGPTYSRRGNEIKGR